jgi:hypothetical protein
LSREQHALDCRLPLGERFLQRLASRRKARAIGLQLPAFRLQCSERAIGIRDGALGFAQRIARFGARCFLLLELFRERADAAAQLVEISFTRGCECGKCRARSYEAERAYQALALPCAETAAMRRSISAASPRE